MCITIDVISLLQKIKWRGGVEILRKHAKRIIADNEMNQYWVFVYEILGYGLLKNDWSAMKKAEISFLKDEYK